jgi:hypothetical protein
VVKRLNAAVGRPSERNLRPLYDAVCDDNVLSIVDRVVEQVAGPETNRNGVHQFGPWLATTGVPPRRFSSHREFPGPAQRIGRTASEEGRCL